MSKKPALISLTLKSITKGLGLEKEMALYHLKKEWPHLVGKTISAHATPVKMQFKTLTLLVDGPTWMHELTFLKEKIIQKANLGLGQKFGKEAIKTLRLTVGQLPPPILSPEPVKAQDQEKLPPEAVALLQQRLSSISDRNLKQVIYQAMNKHLRAKNRQGKS